MLLAKNKPLIVELYGLPGGGKSTLAQRLREEHGFETETPMFPKFLYIWYTLRYPLYLWPWLAVIIGQFFTTKNFSIFRFNISLLYTSLQRIIAAKKSDQSYVVIDEGMLQRVLSYSDQQISERQMRQLVQTSMMGEVVICVNEREPSEDRYDKNHHRSLLGEAYISDWKHNLRVNLDTVRTHLRTHYPQCSYELKDTTIEEILSKHLA